jgi:hypothetical protein
VTVCVTVFVAGAAWVDELVPDPLEPQPAINPAASATSAGAVRNLMGPIRRP